MGAPDQPVMFGRYRVDRLLGRGGMGEVHRAYDTEQDRFVALKRLTVVADDDRAVARFRRECRIAASLDGQHITTIYDYGELDGHLFLAMRLVDGTDLRRLLDAGPLPPERTLRILSQVASALDAAHAKGVVHRDVKPSNILLDGADTAYLADFGIARWTAPDATSVTHTGVEIGTLDYMAPERLMRSAADHRADVYALACVLFECLTSRKPFPADDTAGKLAAQLNAPPPAPSLYDWHIPRALDLVVATGMDKEPGRRYPSAGQLMGAVATALPRKETAPVTTPDLTGGPDHRPIMDAIVTVAAGRLTGEVPGQWCPYPGLRSFSAAEHAVFYGRDSAITDVLVRMSRQNAGTGPLLVVGASGSGKSSLLRAGVLPALTAAGADPPWPQVVTTPGLNPIDTLAARLAPLAGADPAGLARWLRERPTDFGTLCARIAQRHTGRSEHERDGGHGRLVLVVDQFEEVFGCGSSTERQTFATLLASAWPASVLVALRADFLDRCLRLPALRAALTSPYPLEPLTTEELERVIVKPAKAAGLRVEDGLVDRLLTDIGADGGDDPGTLPRLAHALRETWRNSTGGVLTLKDYQDTGGVDRAVARSADSVYTQLSESDRELLRVTLLRLVTVLDGGVTRRRADSGEIPDHILTVLVDARLATADADGVVLAHDALLTAWPRLRDWIDQDRQGILLRQHLGETATSWHTGGRDPGELYRGTRLAAALEWSDTRADLTPLEHEFLRVSRRAQQRDTRRLRTLVTGLAMLLVLALAAGLVAAVKWNDAIIAAGDAQSRQRAAGSLVDAEFNPIRARRKALEAWDSGHTRQARGALLSSASYPYPITFGSGVVEANDVDISQDGRYIAVGGRKGRLRVLDTDTGKRVAADFDRHRSPFDEHRSPLMVAISPDGTMLASMGRGRNDRVLIWEIPSGRPLATVPARGFVTWHPANDTVVALGFPEGMQRRKVRAVGEWDPSSGNRVGWLTDTYRKKERPLTGAFSPDGGRLAVGRIDGVVDLWDPVPATRVPARATRVRTDPRHRDNAMTEARPADAAPRVAFSDDWLASASALDEAIRFADPTSGAATEREIPVESGFEELVFTGDGGHVLTVHNASGGVGRWNVPRGNLDSYLPGPPDNGDPSGMMVSLATAAESGDTVAVKAGGGLVLWPRNPHWSSASTGRPHGVAFTSGGEMSTVSTVATDGLYLWQPKTGALERKHADESPLAVGHADGSRIVVAGDGSVTVTDEEGSVRTTSAALAEPRAADVAVTRDGTRFAVRASGVTADGTDTTVVSVWKTETLERRTLDLGQATASGPVFTADGERMFVTATTTPDEKRPTETDSVIRQWRTADFTEADSIDIDAPGDIAVTQDGASVIVSMRNQVQVIDAATGEHRTEFGKHPAVVQSLALSHDDRLLATGMVGDPTIRLWDMTTGNPRHIASLSGHEGGTVDLAFSRHGTRLASTGMDTATGVWVLDPDTAVRQVCADLADAGVDDRSDLGCS